MGRFTKFSVVNGEVVYAKTGLPVTRPIEVKGNTAYDAMTGRKVGSFGTKNMSAQARGRAIRRQAREEAYEAGGIASYAEAGEAAPIPTGPPPPKGQELVPPEYLDPQRLVEGLPDHVRFETDVRNFARACRALVEDNVISYWEAQAWIDEYVLVGDSGMYRAQIDQVRSELWERLNDMMVETYTFRYTRD